LTVNGHPDLGRGHAVNFDSGVNFGHAVNFDPREVLGRSQGLMVGRVRPLSTKGMELEEVALLDREGAPWFCERPGGFVN
jgi:hypothetical protein